MIWKEYGKTIRRLWLNLFGAVVFGFMLAGLAANLAEKYPSKASLIYIISGVIGTVFYLYLLYFVIWEVGAKDRIKVDGGRIGPRPHQGLKIALVYSLPMIIPGVVYLIAALLREVASVNNGVVNAVSNVSALIAYVFSMPFVGFAFELFGQLGKHIAESGQTLPYSVFLLLSTIPAVILIWGMYWCGYNGKLMSRVFKPKKKK